MHNTSSMLSTYWQRIKRNLLPSLEEAMGPLTIKQQQFTVALEVSRIEEFIPQHFGEVGRPKDDRAPIARAFIAKAIYGHTTTRQLLDQLKSDICLRRLCGWEKIRDIPGEWTFSRGLLSFLLESCQQRYTSR